MLLHIPYYLLNTTLYHYKVLNSQLFKLIFEKGEDIEILYMVDLPDYLYVVMSRQRNINQTQPHSRLDNKLDDRLLLGTMAHLSGSVPHTSR